MNQELIEKYWNEAADIIAQSEDKWDARKKLVKWLGEDHIQIDIMLHNYNQIKIKHKHRNSKLHKALK